MPIITPPARKISWSEIREGLKALILQAAPTARVHNRWGLKYDIMSTISRLQSESDPDVIHTWMIKVAEVEPQYIKTGGGEVQYPLVIDVWGFQGYEFGTDADNTQTDFEDECDDVIAYIDANRINALGLDPSQTPYLKDVKVDQNWTLDLVSFGEGYDVHVCKGRILVKVTRINK